MNRALIDRVGRAVTRGGTIALACWTAAACKPDSITAARDQLQRGGARTLAIRLPVTVDTVVIADFLPEDRDTVVGGVVGVRVDPEAFLVPVVATFLVPVEFSPNDIEFDEFEDAMRDAVINQAKARAVLANDSAQTVVVANFVVGVVELNPDGSIPLDAGGAPRYDTTAAGAPRSIQLADPGDTVVTVSGNSVDTLEFDAPTIMDGLVDLLLDGRRAALVFAGSGSGGGSPTSFLAGFIESAILLDLTLPLAGVSFATSTSESGAELDTADADQVADRVTLAAFTASVVNGSPFAVQVDIAFAEGNHGTTDLFASPPPGTVIINPVTVVGGMVDASGQVTATAGDTVSIGLTGPQTRPLLGDQFTARSRITVVPVPGGNGRVVIRPGDVIVFNARVDISIRAGGTP